MATMMTMIATAPVTKTLDKMSTVYTCFESASKRQCCIVYSMKYLSVALVSGAYVALTMFHLRGTMRLKRKKQIDSPNHSHLDAYRRKKRWHNRCIKWELFVCFFLSFSLLVFFSLLSCWYCSSSSPREWDQLQSDKMDGSHNMLHIKTNPMKQSTIKMMLFIYAVR